MWLIVILLILFVLLYLWGTCSWNQPPLPLSSYQNYPIVDTVPVDIQENYPIVDTVPVDIQENYPVFVESDVCTTRDPVFEVESHSIS